MKETSYPKGAFIGRQPIYDRALNVYAYELLYRKGDENRANIANGDLATSQVIINTFMEIGLENIVGSRPAFINVTRDFFTGEYPLPMSHEQVVFELLETITPDAQLIGQLQALLDKGYRLALDDFELTPATQPLLALAAFVKLDVLAYTPEQLARHVAELKPCGARLIAEKVETPAQYDYCRELGFDYFQGYFFSYPDIIHSRATSANRAVVVNLIAKLQDPDIEVRALEQMVAQDVVLSYRLLRYINCATFSLRREVDSIQQAIMLLGLSTVRNWATLLLISQLEESKPKELMTMALIRARMCELLSVTDKALDSRQAFTTGLFSLLDALLDMPMEALLDQMPLSLPIKLALLNREGPLGQLLDTVIHCERGDWDHIKHDAVQAIDYNSAYLSALNWAEASAKQLHAA